MSNMNYNRYVNIKHEQYSENLAVLTFLRTINTELTSMHNIPAQPKLHPHVNRRGKHHRACPEIKIFQCYGHFAKQKAIFWLVR